MLALVCLFMFENGETIGINFLRCFSDIKAPWIRGARSGDPDGHNKLPRKRIIRVDYHEDLTDVQAKTPSLDKRVY